MYAEHRFLCGDPAGFLTVCFRVPLDKSRRELSQRNDRRWLWLLSGGLWFTCHQQHSFPFVCPSQCGRAARDGGFLAFSSQGATWGEDPNVHLPVVSSLVLSQRHAHRLAPDPKPAHAA